MNMKTDPLQEAIESQNAIEEIPNQIMLITYETNINTGKHNV